jgi:hypothetical protein
MYFKRESEFQYHPGIEKIIMEVKGGGTIAGEDMIGVMFGGRRIDELPPLCVVGKDFNTRLYHVIKTARIIAGGTAAAPHISRNHLFKAGEFISDGKLALEIAAVTKGDTYDTLTFASGSLLVSVPGVVLYQAAAANVTGGTAAAATVTGDAADTLTVSIPTGSAPANFNGFRVTIAQAADDNLIASFKSGILKLSLANTTAWKNNAALIQATIRSLGRVAIGLDFSTAITTGSPGWDDAQTGAVLTNPTAVFTGGVNISTIAYRYEPAAITMSRVNLTVSNQRSGLMESGKVNESVMPFPIDAALKSKLPGVIFA